jgi:hypothetical protein
MPGISVRDIAIFAAIGAAVTLLDALHVYTDTLSYPKNTWFFRATKQPILVPFLFSGSGIVLGLGHRFLLGDVMPLVSTAVVGSHMGVFLCSYAASGFLKHHPKMLSLVYIVLFLRMMRPIWNKVKGAKGRINMGLYFLSVFVIGPMVEAGISSTGRFAYEPKSRQVHGLVPLWLPPLYLTVAIAVSSMDCYLRNHVKQKSK